MATYRVTPLPDGESQNYGWKVAQGSRKVSSHHKKTGAVRRAKREAGQSDAIIVHRQNGTVQRSIGG